MRPEINIEKSAKLSKLAFTPELEEFRGDLPQEMEEPILARFDPNDQPIFSSVIVSQPRCAKL